MALGPPNVVLRFTSPWRGNPHVWSSTAFHSGAALTGETDIVAFLQGYYDIIAAYLYKEGTTYLSEVLYYDGQTKIPQHSASFANAAAATAAGYTQTVVGTAYAEGDVGSSALEACVMLEAPVGYSTTGKPVLLKKFIHAVPSGSGGGDTIFGLASGVQPAVHLGDGTLQGNRVVTSKSGKQGTWSVNPYFGNHQMPRAAKKKITPGLTGLLDDAIKARGILAVAADVAEL